MTNKFLKDEVEAPQEPIEIKTDIAEDVTLDVKPVDEPKEAPQEPTKAKTTGFTLIKQGKKEFKRCNKCGWLHSADIKVCPYCGNK